MHTSPRSLLVKLPNEILQHIGEYLDVNELCFWILTAKRFRYSLNDSLYAKAVAFDRLEHGWPWCLVAAVLFDNLSGFKWLLERSLITDLESRNVWLPAFKNIPSLYRFLTPSDSQELIAKQSNPNFFTTLLHVACALGREDMARLIIDKGGNPLLTDTILATPLHTASETDNLPIMKLLITAGAKVSLTCKRGKSALELASRNGSIPAIQLLLEAGADAVAHNETGHSPLHSAPGSPNSVQVMRILLQAGADISQCMFFFGTPLHCATRRGDMGATKLLLEYGADVAALDRQGETVLHGVWSYPIAKLLISLDKSLVTVRNLVGSTALRSLVLNGHKRESKEELESVALLLIEAGVPVSATANTGMTESFIHRLAEYGCDKAVAAALAVDPSLASIRSPYGLTPLHYAAPAHSEGMVKCVKHLIDAGCDINGSTDDDETALHYAVQGRSLACVRAVMQLLLDAGINISAQNIYGETALHEALLSNNPEAALYLLDAGIDPTSKIFYQRGRVSTRPFFREEDDSSVEPRSPGGTALHCAAHFGYFDVVKRLVEGHNNIDTTDVYGTTALHLAVREGVRRYYSVEGYVNMIALILLGKHQVSVSEVRGQTSLHDLASTGYIAILRYLVAIGADATIQDSRYLSALDIASRRSRRRLPEGMVDNVEEVKKQIGPKANRSISRWIGLEEEAELAEMESLEDLFGGDRV